MEYSRLFKPLKFICTLFIVTIIQEFNAQNSNSRYYDAEKPVYRFQTELPSKEEYRDLKIRNLNMYLDPFKGCLVQIINYQGIDFVPLEIPTILTRFNLILFKQPLRRRLNIQMYNIFYCWVLYEQSLSTHINITNCPWKLENVDMSSRARWTCEARLYLLPPEENFADYGYFKLGAEANFSVGDAWNMNWNSFDFTTSSFNSLSRKSYRILLTEKSHSVNHEKEWDGSMNFVDYRYSKNIIVKLRIPSLNKSTSKDIDILEIYVECPFCNEFSTELFKINISSFQNATRMEEIIHKFNMVQKGRTWIFKTMINGASDKSTFLDLLGSQEKLKFKTLFNGSNIKLKSLFIDKELFYSVCPNTTLYFGFHYDETLPKINFEALNPRPIALVRKTQFYSFVSCGRPPLALISFTGFLSSFDFWTWISIILTVLGLSLIISTMFYFVGRYKGNFGPQLFFMSVKVLLEQGDDIASNSKRESAFYWMSGLWIAMALILSNGYKGQNITDLTAPFSPIPYENFSQLVEHNFSIFCPILSQYDILGSGIVGSQQKDFYDDKPLVQILNDKAVYYLNHTNDKTFHEKLATVKVHPEHLSLYVYNNRTYFYRTRRPNLTSFDILATCNKTALFNLTEENEIIAYKLKSLFPKAEVYLGKDLLFESRTGWEISNWYSSNFVQRLYTLKESGILDEWIKLEQLMKAYRSGIFNLRQILYVGNSDPYPLALDGNIVTIFVVYSAGVFITLITFMMEILFKVSKTSWDRKQIISALIAAKCWKLCKFLNLKRIRND